MKSIIKEVLAVKSSYKLPIYQQKVNTQFLSLDFPTDNVQVCRLNFHKYRDRFMVVVWDSSITFKSVKETIINQTKIEDFDSEDEIVLNCVNLYPLKALSKANRLEENKRYVQVSTKQNKSIEGLDLLETFVVE